MLIEVFLPVYNEEAQLESSVETLLAFMKKHIREEFAITIVDNGSKDSTPELAEALSKKHREVRALLLKQKGRGYALKTAWLRSKADILAYMDIDLSTRLKHFPSLINAIKQGYDISTGSRYAKGAKTTRSFRRWFISRSFLLMLKILFFTSLTDMQCGFKAISRKAAQELLPRTKNKEWFFDTELLLLAIMQGYKIKEIPVEWVEDTDSRVVIPHIIRDCFVGSIKIRFSRQKKGN
ncbi:MAG: glycosyltransferase family 2 protein [Candidatus ainarchaeum sp.]|nr:glycosyltransferase family 2 protein [Candidatus ainarchaeum sp.]